ncbi:MAG: CoA-binding protein [Desulfobacterales bacterium]|nr:MAG: CoA-binding protein [Desulfobacterales bacterium]UCD89172.1 MAG: CoA-binding protein [Desulfobacterales bacterium]
MKSGRMITDDVIIKDILDSAKTIAILGLSTKTERDSNKVARYLQQQGYRVLPVRPGQDEILGEKAYASLDDIDTPVDIVNVFRNPKYVMSHAYEAIQHKPKVFWMQLDIKHQEAAEILAAEGIDVVMDKCIKVEHARLFK